jgi:hypothetical protein
MVSRAARTFFILCSLPLFLFPALVVAQVSLEVEVGFHGVFELGQPFPLTVNLTNLGRPVEGILEVRVWKGGPSKGIDSYPFTYKGEVFLAAQSRKRILFTVNPDSMARPLTVSFSSPGVQASREIDLRGHFSTRPLILLLTGNSGFLSVPLVSDSRLPIVSLSPDELPSSARAYRGIWAVLLYEQSLRDLSRSQRVALEGWLSSGGKILILGGIHYALYQEPSISAFLPVRVLGLKRLAALPNLERYYGWKGTSLRDLLVQDSRFVEGEVVIEENGTPILVEMVRGKGKVLYLSLDVGRPPLSKWEGLSLVFSDLLASPPKRSPGLWTSWDNFVFPRLLMDSAFFSTRTPLIPFLLCLLLYLGGLLLLVRFWEKQKIRRSTLAASFLVFVFLISMGGHLYFNRVVAIPDGVLVTLNVLEGHPDGYAEVQSNVGLFSTRRRDYKFQMMRGWTDLDMVPPRSAGADKELVVIEDAVLSTALRFGLIEWDFRLFRIRSVRPFPFRIEAERRRNRLIIKLANLGHKDLTECWLVISGEGFYLGDIPLGSSIVREFAISQEGQYMDGPGERKGLREIPFKDRGRELLFHTSIFPRDQILARSGERAGFLIGWVQGDSRRVWVNDSRVVAHHYTMFRATLPIEDEEEL